MEASTANESNVLGGRCMTLTEVAAMLRQPEEWVLEREHLFRPVKIGAKQRRMFFKEDVRRGLIRIAELWRLREGFLIDESL